LKGFKKIGLDPGETKTVTVELSLKDSASYFNEYRDSWHLEAGDFYVAAGSSSDEANLLQDFTVKEEKFWRGL